MAKKDLNIKKKVMATISNPDTTETQQVKTPISNAGTEEHEETPIK